MIKVKNTKKFGRGLYADRTFNKNELIERSPLLYIPEKEWKYIQYTGLSRYLFGYGKEDLCLALGYGSLFNHKKKSNVTYKVNFKKRTIDFYAKKKIRKGSQLFIDYGYSMKDYRDWLKRRNNQQKKEKQ